MKQLKWKATLSEPLLKASVNCDKMTGNVVIAFYAKNIEGFFPEWKVSCDSMKLRRNFNSFWGVVRDTLYEYQPYINISHSNSSSTPGFTGRLTGFLLSTNDTSTRDKKGKYYLHLTIQFRKGISLPKQIDDIYITIRGTQLPKGKYSYQYCDKFSARNLPCNFKQYLKVGGTWQSDKGVRRQNCRVFRLIKGNPHQYCSLLLGT